jgi:hypothetical protein
MHDFYSNCSKADEEHLLKCHCHDEVINEQFLLELKKEELDADAPDDLLLRQVKATRRDVVHNLANYNTDNNVRCLHERAIVDTILSKFQSFDLTIPTYALIVNSVINQSLIAFRLSTYLSDNNLITTVTDKYGDEHNMINSAVDYLSKTDRLIIDACEKMHRLKFGEKHSIENVTNSPRNISDLFNDILEAEVEEKHEKKDN